MHKLHIQSESVRRNIELFKQVESRVRQNAEGERLKGYHIFINRINGLLRFSQSEGFKQSEWKHVLIVIDLEAHTAEAFEGDTHDRLFNQSDFSPVALRVVAETMRVMQQIASEIRDVKELAYLEFEPTLASAAARDIVHEAWHEASRVEAEKILSRHAPGTYLFRKDEYAAVLEHELIVSLHAPVKCLTLTYLDAGKIVRDKTIVRYGEQWLVYDDDPTLSGQAYKTMNDLLGTLQRELTKPLAAA